MRTRIAIFAAVAIALPLASRATEAPIFTLTDPRGDDHGDGDFVYPKDYFELGRGDLDLLSLSASPDPEGTWFEATFARPITPTARRPIDAGGGSLDEIARYNFYTFNIDIYIDTDRVAGSGFTYTLPGRKAEIDPSNAWEKAVCLTPRPFDSRQAIGRMIAAYAWKDAKAKGEKLDTARKKEILEDINHDIDRRVFFPTRIRVFGRTIGFLVPSLFLGGQARPEWSYAVAVSGCDILQKLDLGGLLNVAADAPDTLFILPVAPGFTWADRWNGGQDDDPNQPPLVDIIVPPGKKQEEILQQRPVKLLGVVPKDVK